MEKVLVSDIMTRDPITADYQENLFECAKKLIRKRVGSLVLVKEKKLNGFLSQRDILWAAIKKPNTPLSRIKAMDVSPKKVLTIKSESSIQEAIEKMKKSGFERLPVIKDGKLVGMITTKDILNFKPEIYPEMEEFTKIREEEEKLKRYEMTKFRESIYDGICEECGERGSLYRINGMLVCESCNI